MVDLSKFGPSGMRVGTHKMLCSGSKKTGGRSDVLEMAHSRGRLTSRFLVYVIRTRTSSQGFACHSRVGGNLEVFENVTFLDSRLRGMTGFMPFSTVSSRDTGWGWNVQ